MDAFILTGKHVILEPMEESHIDPIYQASLPSEIWEWSATTILSYEDAKNYVRDGISCRLENKHHPFAVVERNSQTVIGSTSLRNIDFYHRTVEIGSTWYHPSQWRTAVNTECKYLLLRHAFEVWEMNRVEFRTDELNKRSRKAISRLGAKEEGMLRLEKRLKSGRVRNTMVYSILRDEWPQVKPRLEHFLSK